MTVLTLGDFTFARGEVPESIAFGASQKLHVHTLVGGARVIDAMGAVPLRPEWSGWFVGPQALARARFLKRLAEAGRPLALRFGEFAYTVVIAEFSAEFRTGPNLPYSITLEVVRDHGAAGRGAGLPGLMQVVAQDLAGTARLAAAIGDSGLMAAVAVAGAAVAVGGGAAGVHPALPAIAVAQTHAEVLNVAASAEIDAMKGLSAPGNGGIPIGPEALSRFGEGLVAAMAATGRSGRLKAMTHMLGRVTTNLDANNGGGDTALTTGSTDLYHLAAAAYGDARGWTRIAQANQRTDPAISGIARLAIPPADAVPATGVLNA